MLGACVVHTSTSGAVAMLEGIPMFSTHEACFSHKWSAGSLSDIEKPILKDRTYYITHFANAHWNLDEVRQGYFGESMYKISLKNIDVHREYEHGDTTNKFVVAFQTGKGHNDAYYKEWYLVDI